MRRNQYARWSGPRVPHERRAELIRTSCTRRVRNPTHRDNLCRGRWLCPGTPVCPEGRCQLNASHHDPATKYRNTPKPPWQLGHWNTKAGARKTSDFRTPVTARSSSACVREQPPPLMHRRATASRTNRGTSGSSRRATFASGDKFGGTPPPLGGSAGVAELPGRSRYRA